MGFWSDVMCPFFRLAFIRVSHGISQTAQSKLLRSWWKVLIWFFCRYSVLVFFSATACLPWSPTLREKNASSIWPKSVHKTYKYTLQFSNTELHVNIEWHKHSTSIICWSQIVASPHHFTLEIHQQNRTWSTSPLKCCGNKHCQTDGHTGPVVLMHKINPWGNVHSVQSTVWVRNQK